MTRRRLRALTSWLIAAACALLVGLAVRQWVLQPVRIVGTSMNDTLIMGDVVLVTKLDYLLGNVPMRGDVVLCSLPGREGTYVKRVVALPGEAVQIADGALYIDGRLVAEDYAIAATEDYSAQLGEDEYLVMGDNRPDSYDSREGDIGSLASSDFLGRVRAIIWPVARIRAVGELRK